MVGEDLVLGFLAREVEVLLVALHEPPQHSTPNDSGDRRPWMMQADLLPTPSPGTPGRHRVANAMYWEQGGTGDPTPTRPARGR